MSTVFNYAISLGSRCHTAHTLNELGLKKYSTPFDWIYTDNKLIVECLKDDFNLFLDKSQYCKYNDKDHQPDELIYPGEVDHCGHRTYNTQLFPHHNLGKDEHYQLFERCVIRLRKVLKSDKPKMFVYTLINTYESYKVENVMDIYNALSEKTNNFTLLVINCLLNWYLPWSFDKYGDEKGNNIYVYNILTGSSDGVRFNYNQTEDYKSYTDIIKTFTYDLVEVSADDEPPTKEKVVPPCVPYQFEMIDS